LGEELLWEVSTETGGRDMRCGVVKQLGVKL